MKPEKWSPILSNIIDHSILCVLPLYFWASQYNCWGCAHLILTSKQRWPPCLNRAKFIGGWSKNLQSVFLTISYYCMNCIIPYQNVKITICIDSTLFEANLTNCYGYCWVLNFVPCPGPGNILIIAAANGRPSLTILCKFAPTVGYPHESVDAWNSVVGI